MEYLAFTVLGDNHVDIANELTNLASINKCNIIDCKMSTMGNEFIANLLICGTWNSIAKMESNLETLDEHENIQLVKQRTKTNPYSKDFLPYIVYVVAKDQAGMLHKVTNFFAEQKITISELLAETRPARKSGAMIMSLTINADIPVEMNIADLRERFIVFCDSYNLDGVMEAEKGL